MITNSGYAIFNFRYSYKKQTYHCLGMPSRIIGIDKLIAILGCAGRKYLTLSKYQSVGNCVSSMRSHTSLLHKKGIMKSNKAGIVLPQAVTQLL
ncbi:hypothetical protein [Labilibaculum euxinus]|uniref:Uncharacterized protein n=1 Tax=Labilibaculum euxinus TaxID=2686357 RepID=A0A7M4D231_9BACT|nr:hypothetical protein [Labilibaculum euxinus]MUP36710.1 hypothetical protein [Labilibaculum euxinus]MVB05915.1 hypothetical protein [Labilibaculum euxinus]